MTLIITIAGFTALALLAHELGHLAAARWCRVTCKELALGLGPRLCGLRVRGVVFNLRAVPLGSFVRLDGTELRSRSVGQQLLVHLGGVLANAVLGVVFLHHPFGWLNLLIAGGNLLPIYQHDGWKCGLVLTRALLGRASRPVEQTFTFSGGFLSLLLILAVVRLGF
ncbi:MAG TPA: site-2 protease family protein [Pyrinomonadaceae bacterium]|nr:site-2 protease family protein [Pyrinomonadaceae bacterium]